MGRRLTAGEARLARQVFGEAVEVARVRIGRGGFGPFAVTLGSRLFLPAHLHCEDFSAADLMLQALFVHELTHVWQFQTRPLWTLASWSRAALSGGYGPQLSAYRYRLPFGDFRRLNLERQASVVEHAFLLRRGRRSPAMPPSARLADYETAPFPLPPPILPEAAPWEGI
jgi:hypothetical protein